MHLHLRSLLRWLSLLGVAPVGLALVGLALVSPDLTAQTSNGYLTGGFGPYEGKTNSQFALGGEWVFRKQFGLGGELGVLAGHTSMAFASLDGYYHFPTGGVPRKFDPFVLAGLGGGVQGYRFGDGVLINFGAGANYWFRPRLGVRFEVRDMVAPNPARLTSNQFWGFRAGPAFH